MSDPTKLDLSDYFGAAITSIVAGVGGAMTWFSVTKGKLTTRMDAQDDRMDKQDVKYNDHTTQLAVIRANHENMSDRLDEIRDSTAEIKTEIQRTAQAGAHSVNIQIAELINQVRSLSRN